MPCGSMVLLEKEMLFGLWKVSWICSSCLCLCLCCFFWSSCFILQVPVWYQLLPEGGRMFGMGTSGLDMNLKGQMKATLMNFRVCNVGTWDPKRVLLLGQQVLSKRQAEKVSANTRLSSQLNLFSFSLAGKIVPMLSSSQQYIPMFLVWLWNQEPEVFPSCTEALGWCLCSGEVGKEDWFYMELPSCWGDSL